MTEAVQPKVLDGLIHYHPGECPSDANPLSRLAFSTSSKLVCCRRGKKIPLDESDKLNKKYKGKTTKEGPILEHADLFRFKDNDAYANWKQFKPHWEHEATEKSPSMLRALRRAFWKTALAAYGLYLVYVLFSLAVPVLMPFLLQHLLDQTEPPWKGYVYIVVIVVSALLASIHYYQAGFQAWSLAAKVRSVLIILTYKKSLRVQAASGKDTGRIVNMVGTDAQVLSDTMGVTFQGLIAPVQLIIITGLLWKEVGAFALIPAGVFVVSIPIIILLNLDYANIVEATKVAADARLKLVREFISAIRIVKYYAWEKAFQRNIGNFREDEVNKVKKTSFIRVAGVSLFAAVPPIATGLVFCLFAINNVLQVNNVFTAVALLNQLRVPLLLMPLTVVFCSQYSVAFSRIREFALMPELAKRPKDAAQPTYTSIAANTTSNQPSKTKGSVAVRFRKASIAWEQGKPVLSNVSLKLKRGTVTMIVGSVGAGKSSLASAVISEVPFVEGERTINGSIAYVPQEAWIINATVRDNILFGKPFDAALYRRVIHASALDADLKIMSAGDMTEIGDRGINLSGGQRQRVSIARALYADRDLLVLDDPLSAVDSHVAAHLVKHVIDNYIKKQGKSAVIVTNQLQFLPHADHIVLLKNGKIAEQGSFSQLNTNGKTFAQLVKDFGGIDSNKKHAEDTEESNAHFNEYVSRETSSDATNQLTGSEELETGSVSASVYWYYTRAGGWYWFFISTFLMVGIASIRIFHSLWLSWWSSPDPVVAGQHTKETWIGVYIGVLVGEAVVFLLRQLPLVQWGRNASARIHRHLLDSLARATTAFFDATPMGRILSRFSKDINLIDDILTFEFDNYIQQLITLGGLFAQMATSQPFLLIVIGGGIIIFYTIQRLFQHTAVAIQRLESVSRAPIFSHLSESIEGAPSIRAYALQKAFVRTNINKVDANIVDYLSLHYSTSWYGLRLDWVGTAIILATLLSVMITRDTGTLNVALAGLALSSTSAVTATLSNMAYSAITVDIVMNSVERIRQYTDVEQEAPAHIKETAPAPSWPEKGGVRFKNLTIEYTTGEPVLKGITATIKPREKVGIVGRTGAGKSTLITALFRMVEPASGSIKIDGVNILKLGLADLRSKLAIIPQLPQLFIGTVRYNIDPFGEATDDQIWHSLEMVKLRDFIASLDGKLEAPVQENGSNFSQGQRQLIAMSRALLRDAKVLLLDEATAAVDNETDSMIQSMVRKNFKDKTVLTIAHRLNTIMDYDRVMVLDKGKVIEFDTPANLLDNPGSIFTSMVDATGPANAEHLRKIARGETMSHSCN